jgi:formyltetrahydrofolate deformylase
VLTDDRVVLLLTCPDQRGVVAAVADFVARHGGNILDADQHVDVVEGRRLFFQRVEVAGDGFDLAAGAVAGAFAPIAERFAMTVDVRATARRVPMAILASRQAHCLADLLVRWSSGELAADVRVVVANHPDHAALCAGFGVPFVHLPVADGAAGAARQEAAVLETLAAHDVELVVMARYMRILSPTAIARYPQRIINIHHSFLPAFAGASPYRQAHDRGVKLIGATAHYATEDLDEGPIIDQDTVRVSHRDDVARLTRAGRDVEVTVLARAVRAHLEHRVLVHGRKTIVF